MLFAKTGISQSFNFKRSLKVLSTIKVTITYFNWQTKKVSLAVITKIKLSVI